MKLEVNYSEYLPQMLEFVEEYRWLVDFAVTDLLISDVFSKIPSDWFELFLEMSYEDAGLLANHHFKNEWPDSLKRFLEKCYLLSMESILSPLTVDWQEHGIGNNLRRGLSLKKQHEVERLSALVDSMYGQADVAGIVDVGSGLGYVDRFLVTKGYNVLGIETNVRLVEKANAKIKNIIPNLADKLQFQTLTLTEESTIPLLKTVEHFCKKHSLKNGVCMIGLHTCGDLVSSSLKMFLNIPNINAVILMPCCYHKMSLIHDNSERIQRHESLHKNFNNFPLSKKLSELLCKPIHKEIFYRPFFRLATQESYARWKSWSVFEHEENAFRVMSRAILQLYAENEGMQVKKFYNHINNKRDQSFDLFINDVIKRFDFTYNSTNDVIAKSEVFCSKLSAGLNSLWKKYKRFLILAEIILILQMSMQSLAEAFVVTDILTYLQENSIEHSKVVSLFDNKISPRYFAIIASKNKL